MFVKIRSPECKQLCLSCSCSKRTHLLVLVVVEYSRHAARHNQQHRTSYQFDLIPIQIVYQVRCVKANDGGPIYESIYSSSSISPVNVALARFTINTRTLQLAPYICAYSHVFSVVRRYSDIAIFVITAHER